MSVLTTGCPRVVLQEPSTVDACDTPAERCQLTTTVKVFTELRANWKLTDDECQALCAHVVCREQWVSGCYLASQTEVVCHGCSEGRPPTNGRMPGETEPWARMAWFEAQSAHEFEHLATQLECVGAPSHFVERARVAANEERSHARIAERRAGRAVNVEDTPVQMRTLEQLAFENFLGGCINESASAVTSAYQSDALGEEDLLQLANEEVGHAELSWELHAWFMSSLDAKQRRELAIAAETKIFAMMNTDEMVSAPGRPSNELRRVQLATLEASLSRPAIAALLQ